MLARVAVATPPNVKLPALIGSGYGSLNCLHALIGASGAGKSTTMETASDLLPLLEEIDIDKEGSIGTGEGIIESYLGEVTVSGEGERTITEKQQTKTRILFSVDEGQIMSDMSRRNGSTLMSVLRSAWSGQTLGQSNASKATSRELKKHTYRLAVVMGFQPSKAEAILEDEDGGTPQRVLWFSVTDPNMPKPEDKPKRPQPFQWVSRTVHNKPLDLAQLPPGRVLHTPAETAAMNAPPIPLEEIIEAAPAAVQATALNRWAIGSGQTVAKGLDAHLLLLQGQTAALLALLADPSTMKYTDEDWHLAGLIVDTSCGVRDWILSSAANRRRRESAARNLAAGGQAVTVQRVVENDAVTRAARSVGKTVSRSAKPMTARECFKNLSSSVRKLINRDDVLALAAELELIVEQPDGTYTAPKS